MRPQQIKTLRLAAMIAGGLLILVALLADELGLDSSPTFGAGETLLLLAGLAAGLAGVLGRRLPACYRDTALLLLNTLMLMAAVELAVITIRTLRSTSLRATGVVDALTDHYLEVPYYRDQEWADQYWQEVRRSQAKSYHPYVMWRGAPFRGQTLNIGGDGIRQTAGAECGPGAYRVFAFGGSSMWGLGAPDWGTIPAHLQAGLAARRREPVCVVNFAQDAYVSTQGLIQLVLCLEAGDPPDLVVFYDGVNDVIGAHQSGRPILHHEFQRIRGRVEQRSHPLVTWLTGLETFRFLGRLAADLMARGDGRPAADVPVLAEEVVDAYLGVYQLVDGLAAAHGFEFSFFWQPYILIGDKPLTPEEQALVAGVDWILKPDHALAGLFAETYRRLALKAPVFPRLHDLSNAFDDIEEQLWIDTWGHVTPVGNEIVVREMLAIMAQHWVEE